MTRYEIMAILTKVFVKEHFDGESHYFGIFFDEKYAYVITKVIIIKMKHKDCASSLFYSFQDTDIEKKVEKRMPYVGMVKKPQNRFLLFESEDIEKPSTFTLERGGETYVIKRTVIKESLRFLNSLITNKRDRKKFDVIVAFKQQCLQLEVLGRGKTSLKKNSVSIRVNNADMIKESRFRINAHNFWQCLTASLIYESIVMIVAEKYIIIENDTRVGSSDELLIYVSKSKEDEK